MLLVIDVLKLLLTLEFPLADSGISCKVTVITIPLSTTEPSVVKVNLIKGVFIKTYVVFSATVPAFRFTAAPAEL